MHDLQKDFDEIVEVIQEEIYRLRDKLAIDIYSLEEECSKQPEQYFIAVDMYSKIYCLVQRMKATLEEERAECGLKIREEPEKYGIAKLTESALNDVVTISDAVIEIKNILNDASEWSIVAKGLVDAYEHRRSMLNNEVQLRASGMSSGIASAKTNDFGKKIEQKRKKRRGSNAEGE